MGSRRLFTLQCTPPQWQHFVQQHLLQTMQLQLLYQPCNMRPHHHSTHLTLHHPMQPTTTAQQANPGNYDMLYTVDIYDTLSNGDDDGGNNINSSGGGGDSGDSAVEQHRHKASSSSSSAAAAPPPLPSSLRRTNQVYLAKHFLVLPNLTQLVEVEGHQMFNDVVCDALRRYRPRQVWTIEGEMYECAQMGFVVRLGRVRMATRDTSIYVIDVEQCGSRDAATDIARDGWWAGLIKTMLTPLTQQSQQPQPQPQPQPQQQQQQRQASVVPSGNVSTTTTTAAAGGGLSTPAMVQVNYQEFPLPDRYSLQHLAWTYTQMIQKLHK